ncbi:MAG: hypothetical protein C0478_17140 [Planctomyces sp.]|nr:hypothetical protein [Planctomyces sp.]
MASFHAGMTQILGAGLIAYLFLALPILEWHILKNPDSWTDFSHSEKKWRVAAPSLIHDSTPQKLAEAENVVALYHATMRVFGTSVIALPLGLALLLFSVIGSISSHSRNISRIELMLLLLLLIWGFGRTGFILNQM